MTDRRSFVKSSPRAGKKYRLIGSIPRIDNADLSGECVRNMQHEASCETAQRRY
jgi:hypothetical protein